MRDISPSQVISAVERALEGVLTATAALREQAWNSRPNGTFTDLV
jgi:hypothetical protein